MNDNIKHNKEEVAKERSHHNMRELLIDLNHLASHYRQSGQLQKALDCLSEALPIEQNANSVLGEAATFTLMGRVCSDMGRNPTSQKRDVGHPEL